MATDIPRMPAPNEYDAPRKGNWQGSTCHQPPEPMRSRGWTPEADVRVAIGCARIMNARISSGGWQSFIAPVPHAGTAANVAAGRRSTQDLGEQDPRYCHIRQMDITYRRWRTIRVSILTSSSRSVVSDHCSNSFGKASVRRKFAMLRRAREAEAHCVVPEGPAGQARPAERVLPLL
jgi:hypothetical protein